MMAPSRTQCNVVHQETREMTTKEAEGLVQDFINAACRVKAAGIDGVEIHGAHGYLINQFLSPYAVFVAEGSSPIIPESINGIHGKNVFTIVDVLSGKTEIYNKKAAVIGSGMTGLETAEFLASKNNDVTVFEMESYWRIKF
ncbi:FAD-dependent oxidoreductase [Clostridium kluyveri]|uniref:Predicted NADH oxidase n=1 Tax=Clostridium kluyveri (strain ATCC 8527 / DSM 555 / NBRC 12016 / NCIMB 10680 / K1) TaxID=431943 RepID=A5N8V1_CLOK5|nr:FAD-dependent oxidoreductase [Clostridium kluyveri]EDK33732.1 Predicted NADH oxidase [Clostridium kluyveri DSM 555]